MFHYCKHQPVIWPSSSEPTTGARQRNLAIIFITADGCRVYPSNKDYFYCSKCFYLKRSQEPLKKRRMTCVFLFVGFFISLLLELLSFFSISKNAGKVNYTLTRVSKYAPQIHINKHIPARAHLQPRKSSPSLLQSPGSDASISFEPRSLSAASITQSHRRMVEED